MIQAGRALDGGVDFTPEQFDYLSAEIDRQMILMEGMEAKAQTGKKFIDALYRQGVVTVSESLMFMQMVDKSTKLDDVFADSWKAFKDNVLASYTGDMHAALRIGAKGIAIEMARSLDVLPPRKRNLFMRVLMHLLGQDERPRFQG